MGIDAGALDWHVSHSTGLLTYTGSVPRRAHKLARRARCGQVLLSERAHAELLTLQVAQHAALLPTAATAPVSPFTHQHPSVCSTRLTYSGARSPPVELSPLYGSCPPRPGWIGGEASYVQLPSAASEGVVQGRSRLLDHAALGQDDRLRHSLTGLVPGQGLAGVPEGTADGGMELTARMIVDDPAAADGAAHQALGPQSPQAAGNLPRPVAVARAYPAKGRGAHATFLCRCVPRIKSPAHRRCAACQPASPIHSCTCIAQTLADPLPTHLQTHPPRL